MRIWSLASEMIDGKGFVACWREGLLAQNVLLGNTVGYRNHPQLDRFKKTIEPVQSICNYLHTLCDEADRRGYKFSRSKIVNRFMTIEKIPVTIGQLDYEFNFLKQKVLRRTGDWKYNNRRILDCINPTFYPVLGDVEYWEKVK